MSRFADKTVIITGGGSGIGKACAELFARDGAKVVVADLAEESAMQVVEQIQRMGGDALFLQVDTSLWHSVQQLVADTLDAYGSLDIYINNAGVFDGFAKCMDTTDKVWDQVINVNLKGYFHGCRAALPELIKSGGNIVMTASIAGLGAGGGGTAYTASKFGTVGLIKQIACEYADQGVRVNGVAPGGLHTGMTDMYADDEAVAGFISSRTPLGRWGEPEEVASAIAYLASADAGYVTGSILSVDGGWRAQ
ncbi:MAG: short-chain dehydrogenase [Gammaproteobacteria bacterium]|nr:MAG: short-chain dehydrogenase [Gammaproteobacteria bacterium]RLA15421.1 MAG: short-chain dehydrogenase [Gammaproteobacteria bacterium]RLA17019.1 MAG: short-chain dehydrogenase [Gammaproteobacteria bacterium]